MSSYRVYQERSVFEDREEGAHALAERLSHLRGDAPIVLALPRGGVEVGYYVAQALNAPLDVIVARKLGAPGQEELGIGAIAPGGVRVVDEMAVRYLGIRPEVLDRIAAAEAEEMERRQHLYRGDRPMPDLKDRTVIIVDDGLATGVTARAAIESVLRHEPRRVVLAVPVCAGDTADAIRSTGIDVICGLTPEHFRAVGYWYREFNQLTDEEVIGFLARARAHENLIQVSEVNRAAARERGISTERSVRIDAFGTTLEGDLTRPPNAEGIVLFAHGSGSSRHSPRNRYVAGELQRAGLATLLLDLLSAEEEEQDARTGHLRFDIRFLAARLLHAMDWLQTERETRTMPIGCFGASTGAGAALVAASDRPRDVKAVVSRGGRPDLAGDALELVEAPTLLIVGGADGPVVEINREALSRLGAADKKLVIIPGASHLFPEPGALEEVARLAVEWFARHLISSRQ